MSCVVSLYQCSLDSQYAYSAWAPQFATRMKLTKTESNLIVSGAVVSSDDRELKGDRVHLATWACMRLVYPWVCW